MTWLTWLLTGFSGGIIVGVLIDRDTVNKYYNKIRKVKTRGRGNIVDVSIDDLKKELKLTRKERRQKRRAERRSKRLAKD